MTDDEFTVAFRERFRAVLQKVDREKEARAGLEKVNTFASMGQAYKALDHAGFMLDGAIDQLGDLLREASLAPQPEDP